MAYAGTVTKRENRKGGRRIISLDIAETEARDTSEWSYGPLPRFVTMTHYQATRTAGTGTTINPRLGTATGWTASTQSDIGTNTTTAAHINDQTLVRIDGGAEGWTLYGKSQPNSSATDHTISTKIALLVGHY